jgi:hypothetical protein
MATRSDDILRGPAVIGSVNRKVIISNSIGFHYGAPMPGQERIPLGFCTEAIAAALARSKRHFPSNDR